MKRVIWMVMMALASGAMAELKTEDVSYDHGGVTFKGYLAWDDAVKGKRPGVLVVHEWWGHNEYARTRAAMLAKLGYTALAVDMYGDGKTADHPKDAGAFSGKVMSDMPAAKGRFDAALKVLRGHATVKKKKTAAIGYCFGGGVVLHMARMNADLRGVVSFHGSLGAKVKPEGKVVPRILVCHGADDKFIPAEQITAFKKEMADAGADMTFKSYEGALHSFTNPGADEKAKKFNIPLGYNKAADEQSWKDMQAFLDSIFK